MNRTLRLSIPFILGALSLGILFYFSGKSNLATASINHSGEPSNKAITSLMVNTLDDEYNNDGDCSLREALQAANTNLSIDACGTGDEVITDTITFDTPGTIHVTNQLQITAGGPLVIDGGGVITSSGGGTTRVWWMDMNSDLVLQNITVANGYVSNDNGAGLYNNGGNLTVIQSNFIENHFSISDSNNHYGGGIYSIGGTLDVTEGQFEKNGSDDRLSHGGGIYVTGSTGEILQTNFLHNESAGCLEGIPCTDPGGGAIYLVHSTYEIQGSTFISNTSNSGAGGILNSAGTLTLTNSIISDNTGSIGGGIWNHGVMNISNSTFTDNHNNRTGGGIYNNGTMTISNCTFVGNSSLTGGAISTYGNMSITDSTFSGNQATRGGAINNLDHLLITGSTFTNNTAQENGGAIRNIPIVPSYPPIQLTITNSTLNGNHAGYDGGGIMASMFRMDITNSTISANYASRGGGIFIETSSFISFPVTLTNTIIANNFFGGDCLGNDQIIDGGHNIASDGSCNLDPANGSMPNTDPHLGPLQDNGGPTWTQALLWASLAIDRGDDGLCPLTDQRGVHRPQDGNGDGLAVCDIGAYEFENEFGVKPFYLPLIAK